MQDDDPDFKLPQETVLVACTLFCLALFGSFTLAATDSPPPASAIAYPIDASLAARAR